MDMEQHAFNDRRNEAASFDHTHEVDPPSDRREHSRHITVMRVARLSNQSTGVEGLGVVRNVSSGGMMIDARIATEIQHIVVVSMLDDQCVTGEVVWQDGTSIGLRFAERADVGSVLSKPARDETGKRVRLPRLTVNQTAEIKTATASYEVALCDISQRGAKLEIAHRLLAHEQIWLSMPECRPVRGTVRWRDSGYVGVEFHRLLGVDELAQWLPAGDSA